MPATRKRQNDGNTPAPKRVRRSRKAKEEEKENIIRTSVNSTPDASIAGSSRVSPIASTNRRKTKPVNLCNLEKTLTNFNKEGKKYINLLNSLWFSFSFLDVINKMREENIDNRMFLVRNVVRWRKLEDKHLKFSRRRKVAIADVLPRLQEKMVKANKHYDLCTVNFTGIRSLGTFSEHQTNATNAASVQTYTIIVDEKKQVQVLNNALCTISLEDKFLSAELDRNLKKITLTAEEFTNAQKIYFATVVTRMVLLGEKRFSRMATVANPKGIKARVQQKVEPEKLSLMKEVRIGCTQMYQKDKFSKLHDGVMRILLRDEDDPFILSRKIFKQAGSSIDWLVNVDNLHFLSEKNSTNQDAHTARLIFEVSAFGFHDILEEAEKSRVQSPRRSRANTLTSPKRCVVDKKVPFSGHTEKGVYYLMAVRKAARFPWFRVQKTENELVQLARNGKWFEESVITHIADSCFYRKIVHRSRLVAIQAIAAEREAKIAAARAAGLIVDDTRNSAVGKRKVYGLDFVQSEGHGPFLKNIYRTRDTTHIPPLIPKKDTMEEVDLSERNDPVFSLGNAPLCNSLSLRLQERIHIPKKYENHGSEMSVVNKPASQVRRDVHNTKLKAVVVKKSIVVPRKKNPAHVVGALDTDLDGRPFPTTCEIFFPYAKHETYNMLLKDYIVSIGWRGGSYSSEQKSRLLSGFIEQNYEMIFEHGLENVYLKHLQVVGMHSFNWKQIHYTAPRDKYLDLKKKWTEQHCPSTSRKN
ncbi:Protein CBR-MES-3 [Caenorhabditis briggsae]|uniref:Protein CBR-MES-3 n=1 Tax=Caenorhabditis briggsae TaxID=6238 RepID=A8XBR8_CAEBR|nr:Protein CBR-MES-3 [Caenorhabditis briggsae]CAP30084.2 Protein CBR-MES-3 [Caenorhabditis briggsae]